MKRYFLPLLIAGALIGLLGSPVVAQEDSSRQERLQAAQEAIDQRSTQIDRVTERAEALDDAKRARVEERCTIIKDKVETHQANIDTYRDAHFDRYQSFTTKVNTLVDRLEGAGYDATKLKSNMIELEGLVGQARIDFANYEVILTEVTATDCAAVEGESLYDLVQDARAAHPVAKSSIVAIKEYITGTIKPSLEDLKTQFKPSEEES